MISHVRHFRDANVCSVAFRADLKERKSLFRITDRLWEYQLVTGEFP